MSRIQSIDALRAIAIFSVIAIHTTPFEIKSSPVGNELDIATIINQLARFAVPCFFILSGYFWAEKFKNSNEIYAPTMAMAKRILAIFIGWSVFYLIPTDSPDLFSSGLAGFMKRIYWNISSAIDRPFLTLMEGTKVHLWFMVGLLCSLCISALLLRFQFNRSLLVAAVALYFIGLSGKAYSNTPVGFHVPFNFRDGPFFSLIFFVTGYFLQRSQPHKSWLPMGLLLSCGGIALHFTEIIFLHRNWGATMLQDYVIGTYFYGLGVTLVFISRRKWAHSTAIASIGPLVLGIYAVHYAFVDILKPLIQDFYQPGISDIFFLIIVFLLSYLVAFLLSRNSLTRRFVT